MRQINGYSEYYATTCGQIISTKATTGWQFLKGRFENGYLRVALSNGGKSKNFSVARLVCAVFHDNLENKRTVNHKNGVTTDNRVSNLEWATHSEQQLHSYRVLGKKAADFGKFGVDNKSSKAIEQIKNGIVVATFGSQLEAQRITGIDRGNISTCCRSKKRAGGYHWALKNDS